MILGASQLRTRLCGRSSLTAGLERLHDQRCARRIVDSVEVDTSPYLRVDSDAVRGAALLLGLGGFAAVVMWRRHAKPLLPHERALMRLEQAQPLALAGQVREYAGAASDAVREYIEERFLLRAAHLTTEEFFENLVAQENSSLGSHRESLLQFIGACDLAKFARFPLARERMVSLNDLARRFVLDTAPSKAETQPAPARTS
jgi:hypothetical protein